MTGPGADPSDRLFALPIRGESFLLRRGRHTILVDGGNEGNNLVGALQAIAPDLKAIDVVVCTHGDADHAGGLVDLLRDWRGPIGQVWLPGQWADVVPELLQNPRDFVNGLIKELDDLRRSSPEVVQGGDADEIEEIMAERVRNARRVDPDRVRDPLPVGPTDHDEADPPDDPGDEDPIDLGATEPVDEPGWFSQIRDTADKIATDEVAASAFRSGQSRIDSRRRKGQIGAPFASFWLGLVKTGKAIRGIAEQAVQRQIRVRWFDFNEFSRTRTAVGGVRNFLEPINAVEQAPLPIAALAYLQRLSPINEESLVFFAPPNRSHLGVLFCGDSPFADAPTYQRSFLNLVRCPRFPIVATAPHHGSSSNDPAYDHVKNWALVAVWLRTGGDRRQPGAKFKLMAYPQRVCAYCPQSGRARVLAGVMGSKPWHWPWPFIVTGHTCVCL
jgi:hypothetical protein